MLRGPPTAYTQLVPSQNQLSSGMVEGFNAKAKLTTRRPYDFSPIMGWKSPCIIRLVPYPSPSSPTDFPEEVRSLFTTSIEEWPKIIVRFHHF
jgi:hypothetical protein